MALANDDAADVLANQGVRDACIAVLQDFQDLSQSNSNVRKTLADIQLDVTTLVDALDAAGADLTPTP